MDAHSKIRLQEVIGALIVWDPFTEEDVAIQQTQFTAILDNLAVDGHLWNGVHVEVLASRKVQLDIITAGKDDHQGIEEREWIEPLPQPTVPEEKLVICADARVDAFQDAVTVAR